MNTRGRITPWTLLGVLLLATLAGPAHAATTGDGTVVVDVGQLIEITVPDASISLGSEFTPVSGSETLKSSTSDYLRFSNAKSNVQASWGYQILPSFVQDSDGTTSTTTVQYQGQTVTLSDLAFVTQSSSGDFIEWEIVTGSDLAGDGGFTNNAGCGTLNYKGSFSISYYANTPGSLQTLTRYYTVCDSVEIWVDSDKDMTSGADFAYMITNAVTGATASAANYEIAIGGQNFIFHSAASATTVTLRAGKLAAFSGSGSTTGDVYALLRFPDGFPAGVLTTTIRGTATDIVT